LWREPERRLDPGEGRIRLDLFGRSIFHAWTGSFSIAVKKLDLAQRLSWIVAGPIYEVGAIRVGENRARNAQRSSERNVARKSAKGLFLSRV
jgi:hypothetical protein